MILDGSSGQIRWAPTSDQVGLQQIVLAADDGRGGRTTQEFTIDVQAARSNAAPVITTSPVDQFSAKQLTLTTWRLLILMVIDCAIV